MSYDRAKAEAVAHRVATAFPCQGVRVRPHPTVDAWVLVHRGPWPPMPYAAHTALDLMKQWRASQRKHRKGKRNGT